MPYIPRCPANGKPPYFTHRLHPEGCSLDVFKVSRLQKKLRSFAGRRDPWACTGEQQPCLSNRIQEVAACYIELIFRACRHRVGRPIHDQKCAACVKDRQSVVSLSLHLLSNSVFSLPLRQIDAPDVYSEIRNAILEKLMDK